MAFAGFDCGSYPGDSKIQAWAVDGTYKWCGFYLTAPCHGAAFKPWTGKYQFLRGLGLGLAILYVGRQQDGCGSDKLSRGQGQIDGLDAIAQCNQEGFPQNAILFLDVERFDGGLSPEMKDYYQGWLSSLLDDGKFKPGTYCAKANAIDLVNAAQQEYANHGLPGGNPAFWVVKTDSLFDPQTSVPTECGISFANVWQGRIDVQNESHGGVTISPIDQDVADTADPSATLQSAVDFLLQSTKLSAAQSGMDQIKQLLDLVRAASKQDDPKKRFFFPNGIDLIDANVKFDAKEGVTFGLKLQGPPKP